jgi:multidrug efflux system membrane fusion protein
VVVNQVQPISVIFSVPEDNVPALLKKVRQGASMKVEAYDHPAAVKLADGKLSTIDNAIDTSTGTVKLRAQFENADGSLFPNQFVNVSLLLDLLQNQLIMPNSAVRRGAPNGVVSTFVYLVKADQTVAVRPVTLGTVDGERVAVASGVAAGDVVVTEGGDRLRDGAPVQLPAAAPAPAASAAPAPAATDKRPPGAHRRPRTNNAQ